MESDKSKTSLLSKFFRKEKNLRFQVLILSFVELETQPTTNLHYPNSQEADIIRMLLDYLRGQVIKKLRHNT